MSSPDEIRAEIDDRRDELSADMAALQNRLDPSRRAADLLERLAARIRERPWPVAAAAFTSGWAAAWLLSKL